MSFLKSSTTNSPPIIGLDVVGHGITLMPDQAYELKEVLFKTMPGNRIFYSTATGKTYSVPDKYQVTENPSVPASQGLDEIIVEDSWERFEKHFHIDAHMVASHNVLSVDVKTSQIKQLHSAEDSFYALRSFFIPLWTLYIPDVTAFSFDKVCKLNIPTPFQPKYRKEYEKFFERYGTHYIKRAWIGGKMILVFTIAKSTQMTKQDIRKGLHACYALTSNHPDNHIKENLAKLQRNSNSIVLGQGGEPTILGVQGLLEQARYQEWMATIKKTPKVVEFEAVGIWNFITDNQKAKALLDAYKAATIFIPFSAIFSYDGKRVYFFRGQECTCYHIETCQTGESKLITEMWPSLSEIRGFETVEAILKGTFIKTSDGKSLNNKLFLFKGNQCVCLDLETKQIDEGYPKPIAEQWPGVTFERVDAILNADSESVYFFMGNQYIRYNLLNDKADSGYPILIKERWDGITFDHIDAIIVWKNGKTYFFSDNEYICYDIVKYRVNEGYPKRLVGHYIEEWNIFD